MRKMKRALLLLLILSVALTLIPVQAIAKNDISADNEALKTMFSDAISRSQNPVAYQSLPAFGTLQGEAVLINSPSLITYDTQVSYEIVTVGRAGITDSDVQSAVVRFMVENPGEQQVLFNYTVVPGSVENGYLTGTLSGTVSLSKDVPQKDVRIEITPFADNPGEFSLPNTTNAFWSGTQFFYLFCDNIHNAMFEGNRESLTVPVPVQSEFDYMAAYENAVNNKLINLNEVAGGANGVYTIPDSGELRLIAEISGDVRKMLDASVLTHVYLPNGYFINESDMVQNITYSFKAKNDTYIPPREAFVSKSQFISLAVKDQTSFYSEDFPQELPVEQVNLGVAESNGIFNKLEFIFDYSMVSSPDAISTRFLDNEGHYIQKQVNFSDKIPPVVKFVSTGTDNAKYGDDIPVVIEFSEPVYTDGITFKADGQTLTPMEKGGTISQRVSFLYRVGDNALNAESFTVNVTDITGATDISGKVQESPGSAGTSVGISFDPRLTFAYCAEPSVSIDQGTSRNMAATVLIPLKPDTKLSNWLISRVSEGNISTAVKARAITAEGNIFIPLTLLTNEMQVTGLTGSFTVPENNTGEDVYYALEIYLDTGSGDALVYSLAWIYTVQPLIFVEGENDITIDYSYWPSGDKIFINAGSSLSLGYFLNVDATWKGSEYFKWTSSDESIAKIDNNGDIILMGTGQVYFTLTVTNPITEAAVQFRSKTLSVIESQDAYLYVPNGIKNQDLLIGSDAKISFSSNLSDRNELYGGEGTITEYSFTLYEADYDEGGINKGSQVLTEVLNATSQATLNSYTIPASLLTKVTEKNRYGYILEISAEDISSGITLTTQANIRIRRMPAKASLIRPESVFLLDNITGFTVGFDIENKTSETEYSLTIIKNSETTPVKTAASPGVIEPVTADISEVGRNRLLDVYTVSLKAKNLLDEVWSYDSYSVYVYNRFAMNMLLDGFPAPDSLTLDYDFKDGEIIYNTDFLKYRSMIGRELIKTLSIDNISYTWSAISDKITWQAEGESVSLWYKNRRIGDNYNPALLPGTSLLLLGEGAGSTVVTATHNLTGMTDSMNVTLEPLNDKLYLFRVHQDVSCELVYTNGNGQEKTVTFSREVGIYEDSGIKSDVVIYPTGGAENVYGFGVINHNTLTVNQKSSGSFDLYPINTLRLPYINYNVSLELFDEVSGLPYKGDIIIRGGVYYNNEYQKMTTINSKMGNADQIVSADKEGRYSLSFRAADFTGRLLTSDELRYVIEVGFADNSYLTQYIIVENDAIKAYKGSPMGVCLKEGIKPLNSSSIQNSATIISQTLTIDGEEKPVYNRILLDEYPKNAVLDMTVSVPQYSSNYHQLVMYDSSGRPHAASGWGEIVNAYPFSDSITLHFVCDITSMLIYEKYSSFKPGQIYYYYPSIRSSDWCQEIKLSKPIEVQNLQNISNMDNLYRNGDLKEIFMLLWAAYGSSEDQSLSANNDAVKDALDIMNDYSVYTTSIGLEVKSTDDPLVYKGIIRFAAGNYSADNPSGVFVGSGEETSFNFMPGASDIKAMGKGKFLKKAKEEMNDSRNFYKRYGGGAYIECLVYYSIEEYKWKISLIYGDFYLGGGGTYRRNYNGWVSFVPVTASFRYNMTAELGLTILNSQLRNETAYIPRIRPVFSIYGFGGVGRDYEVVSFKAGPYGFVQHEQNYLWYTDNNGLKMDGQQLKISGEVGVEFSIVLLFVNLKGKYVLSDYSKSWNYNDYRRIQDKIADNLLERSSIKGFLQGKFFTGSEGHTLMLVPVEESAAFEDRSYLEAYERFWGSQLSGRRMFTILSAEELTHIWTNAYPNAAPRLSDDGELMIYMSDMDSEDLSDTAVLFALKDGTGEFSTEGTEIYASDFPDSMPSLSGTKDGASAAWIRSFTHMGGEAGSTASMEDVINGLAASEIMTGIFKEGKFTSTRLTNNDNPDLSPVTAATGNKAITAWRSVTMGNLNNPLDFTSDYIMYSVYNGSDWSEAKYLYDGSIDIVRTLNTAILPDGTSAIVYQITEANGNSEIICAILDEGGAVVRSLSLTDNMTEDLNPQITTAEFPDGVKRFVIGWNAHAESDKSTLQMVAVNADGTLYHEFTLELSDSTGTTEYSNFQFTKGAYKLEDLSAIWSEPEDSDKDGIYEYSVLGTKLLMSSDNIVSASGKQKLLTLNEGNSVDSLDCRVNPDTEKVHLVMLLSEPGGSSTLTTAIAEYKNILASNGPYYEYEDLLPGLDMPVMFTLKNDGVEPISNVTIALGDNNYEYGGEALAPGDEESYLISYPVPDQVTNANYSITAQFGTSGDTCVLSGVLKLDVPDVGIYQIDSTRETQRERGFRVLLLNAAFADLKKDIHSVKLEIWDRADFINGTPLKTIPVSGEDLNVLNNSLLSMDVTLTEEDLQCFLDEEGEIPEGSKWLLFRVVLTEDGKVIEDSDISNNIDFANVYSMIEKKGKAVSLASFSKTNNGKTTVQVEAINNSMKTINNGNIIVTLRDANGNVLETQQTYKPEEDSSLLNIPGEESKTVSLVFNSAGYTADVTFAGVSRESTLLSALNLTGILLPFEPKVYEYNLQSYGLNQTLLTTVAENPDSVVMVMKDGIPVSMSNPIPLSYGANNFIIRVTTGGINTTYRITVENKRIDDGTNQGEDIPVIPDISESSESTNYHAGLTIDGNRQKDLKISLNNRRAVVSLGSLAQEIFSVKTDAAINIPSVSGVDGYTLELPGYTLAGSYTGATVTVSTEFGSVRIPAGMLMGMADLEGKTAGINIVKADKSKLSSDVRAAIGDHPMLSLTLTLDGEEIGWSNPETPVLVCIPYTPTAEELKSPESIVIRHIERSDRAVSIPNGRYDPVTGTVNFLTIHFSDFAVVYNPVTFNDVASSAWYSKPISFIAARGITYGTGKGKYSPEGTLTRGEFIVLLMRAYGIKEDENIKDNFSDAGSSYYTGYLAAAKRLGISLGVGNNMFDPDKTVTRQEMFTLLYNTLRTIKQLPEMNNSDEADLSKSITDFTDEGQIATWAREAMELLVETGIINGNDGMLKPLGASTRAQMAQVLYNLMTK